MHIIFISHIHTYFFKAPHIYFITCLGVSTWRGREDFACSQHSCPLLPQERHNMQRTSCPLAVALLVQSLQLWQHDCGGSTLPWSVLPCAREFANMLTLHIHITSYNRIATCIYMYYNILVLALTFRLQRFLRVLFALPFAFAAATVEAEWHHEPPCWAVVQWTPAF